MWSDGPASTAILAVGQNLSAKTSLVVGRREYLFKLLALEF
jgi:hypothetical protein